MFLLSNEPNATAAVETHGAIILAPRVGDDLPPCSCGHLPMQLHSGKDGVGIETAKVCKHLGFILKAFTKNINALSKGSLGL